jgi:hypothetical protein
MKLWAIPLLFLTLSVSADVQKPRAGNTPENCDCSGSPGTNSCGIQPASLSKSDTDIAHDLGFEVPSDHIGTSEKDENKALFQAFASFLEKSDHAPMLYPEYYTRATRENSVLTLKTVFQPKNSTETDEYLRCTIPGDKYCLYKTHLRSYIGLASKASGIPFSFLACQAYVESRFKKDARSNIGAIGYSQIKPSNIKYLNEVLQRSIRNSSNRSIASVSLASPRGNRIKRAQQDIAHIWTQFWKGTKKMPKNLKECDLTCYRQAFLAQAISLKTDMLALATSSSGLKADYDDVGDFRIEGMDKGDSLLLLAGSYNVGVTNMIRLISRFCSDSTKLKDCLHKMTSGTLPDPAQEQARKRDVAAVNNYVMRIRDCSQQFSAEQIDFDDDGRWSSDVRTEKQNEQRDSTVQCLLHPCPLRGQ